MDIQHLQQLPLEAVVAIVVGILVLLVPRILNYAVATYLLVVGVIGVLHFWYGQTIRPQTIAALVAGILILVKPAVLNYVVGIYLILIGVLELGVLRFWPWASIQNQQVTRKPSCRSYEALGSVCVPKWRTTLDLPGGKRFHSTPTKRRVGNLYVICGR